MALQEAGRLAKAHYPLNLSVTLVDNSDDDAVFRHVAQWLDRVRTKLPDWEVALLQSPGNLGYGRGNNLVIENIRSDYHMVVNPDLFLRADALLEAVRYMEAHRDVGLLSPAVFGENGERQYLCKRNPTLLIMFLRSVAPAWVVSRLQSVMDKFEMRDCDYSKEIHPIEYPTGCLMFFRTRELHKIGGFDPNIFLHYEDADIGRRLLAISRANYVPSVVAVHQWTRDTHKSLRAMLTTIRSGWYYWRKWGGVFSSRPAREPGPAVRAANCDHRADGARGEGRRVLVTGAAGFIGRGACAKLQSFGFHVCGAVRKADPANAVSRVDYLEVGDIDENTDWRLALSGVDSVVHLAARVHVMLDASPDPLAAYRRDNVAATVNLAQQAAAAGVRRFVFVSSIKVNGEITPVGQPFTADDIPKPQDPYGVSKLEAERALQEVAARTGMEVVIIRPPLVYGPGVKANFLTMMQWLAKGVPLPVGALDQRRSLVALDNLVDFIATCLWHPSAANQIFLVSDGEDLTVTELVRRTAAFFPRRSRLLPIPAFVLEIVGRLVGRTLTVVRLCTSLQVDIAKGQRLLGWQPPTPVDVALRETVRQFRSR